MSLPGNPEVSSLPSDTEEPGTAVASCRADELDGSATWEGAGGSLVGTIDIRNKSNRTCKISGYPTIGLLNGKTELDIAQTIFMVGDPSEFELQADKHTQVRFVWSNWCENKLMNAILLKVEVPEDPGYLTIPIEGNLSWASMSPRCDAEQAESSISVGPFEKK